MIEGSLALTLLRAGISLALVLGLLIWSMRVLARRGGLAPTGRTPVVIDVLGRRQLSRGASVQVVRIGSRTYVLGVGESEVSVLGDLSPEDLPADEEPEQQALARTGGAASPVLVEALRRQGQIGRFVADLTGRRSRGGRHRGRSRV